MKFINYMQIVFLFFLFYSNIYTEEIPEIILKASTLYQKERSELKNYKSSQKLTSKLSDSSGIVIEKREQIGIFRNNNEFIFITNELEINGIKQILNKEIIERTSKLEFDWFSKDGISNHQFQFYESVGNIQKFLVNPKIIRNHYFRGQIWIDKVTHKILRIIKEPIIKKKEIEKYTIELRFEREFQYQLPTYTKLIANYSSLKGITKVEIDVLYENYQFNLKTLPEINK